HAGYSYSGQSAAYAYKCIDPTDIPSHHVYLDGCALSQCDEYETPLGNLVLDREVIDELQSTGRFTNMSHSVDEDEHSIEMHLPYVFKVMSGRSKPFTIVPILVGAISTAKEQQFGELLAPYLKDSHNLFVISSDFCHWGRRFSYTFQYDRGSNNASLPIHQQIELVDREGMGHIEQIDAKGFAAYLKKTRNTICGRHPIGILLNALETIKAEGEEEKESDGDRAEAGNVELKFTYYAQSSKVVRENDSSVSYASAFVRFLEEDSA
ncbi:hypothetical protein HK102_005386, partial [Quaeritorhiza haematococci]